MKRWLPLAGIGLAALAAALAIAWLAAVIVLHDSSADVGTLVGSLVVSGVLAVVIGSLVIVLGMPLLPRLVFKIVIGYLVVSLAAILTILYTPVSMFMQPRDLHLLILLLAYFLIIAAGLAGIISVTVARPLHALAMAARAIGAGAFRTHVQVASRDELLQVATAFNRMSDELAQAAAREQTLEEGRRRMIAAISHDLRTPLTGVRLTLEGIRDGLVRDQTTITRALSDIDQLGRLIEDLFELSQLEDDRLQLDCEAVNVGQLVSRSVDQLRPIADQQRVSLLVSAPEGLADLVADPIQLQRAIVNLVQNGIQHTPSGGSVCIGVHQSVSSIVIEVADTGAGITPDDLPYIFDYFYRADEARERNTDGAGLGLSIAKAIVGAHGGTVQVESTPGQGTRFTIILPIS